MSIALQLSKNVAPCFFPLSSNLTLLVPAGCPASNPARYPSCCCCWSGGVFAYYVIWKLTLQNLQLGEPPFFMATFFLIWLLGTPTGIRNSSWLIRASWSPDNYHYVNYECFRMTCQTLGFEGCDRSRASKQLTRGAKIHSPILAVSCAPW